MRGKGTSGNYGVHRGITGCTGELRGATVRVLYVMVQENIQELENCSDYVHK